MDASSNSADKPETPDYIFGEPTHVDRDAIPKSAAKMTCAYCGGDATDRPVDYYACCAACYERIYEGRRNKGHATRKSAATELPPNPTWRNGYLEGWRCAMESAKGGDWSAEYPDGW